MKYPKKYLLLSNFLLTKVDNTSNISFSTKELYQYLKNYGLKRTEQILIPELKDMLKILKTELVWIKNKDKICCHKNLLKEFTIENKQIEITECTTECIKSFIEKLTQDCNTNKNVIVKINLKIETRCKERNEAIEYAKNYELPHGYVKNSFKIIKVANNELTI